MKPELTTIALIFFVASCQTNQSNNKSAIVVDSKVNSPFSVIDSLNKYADADSLIVFDTLRIYIGKVNEINIGLVQTTDTVTLLYQKINNSWSITDTLNYPLAHVQLTDLNNDNYKDLIVTYFMTAAGANDQNICLIYYPSIKQFHRNEYFDLPNIGYDNKSNLVFSAWWASANHPQEKMTYKITGDSLTFKQGVTYEPDEETQGDIGTVEFYTMQEDKRIITKKIKGKSDKTLDIFTKALWDTSDE